MNNLIAERNKITPKQPTQPARQILRDAFYLGNQPIVPQFGRNPVVQMIQLAKIKRYKTK